MAYFGPGTAALSAVLTMIVFFSYYLHLQRVVQADDVAENLKNQRLCLPVSAGRDREYLEYVGQTGILALGSGHLAVLAVVYPRICAMKLAISVLLWRTQLLIVVSGDDGHIQQVQSHLLANQYEV